MFRSFTIGAVFVSIYSFAYIFSKEPFEFYLSYLVYMIYLPIFFSKYGLPKWPILLFIPLFISGFVYVQMGENSPTQFYKTFVGFFLSTIFYHYVVQVFDYDVKLLFKYYMKSAYIMSIIGLIQIISYNIGFRPGYDYHLFLNKWNVTQGGLGIRVNAFFSEPAYYAATIAPAFFVAVYNLIKNETYFISRRQSILVAAAYTTTFSSVGILGILLTFIFLLINLGFFRYVAIYLPLIIGIGIYSYSNVPEFRDRLDGMFELYETNDIYSYDIHGSSFVLYNNSHVAWENFIRNPLFGTGLGSHPMAFEKYSYTNVLGAVQLDYNSMDANSMFLRLMSETGFYGMFVFLLLLFGCWVFRWNSPDESYWLISNAIAVVIILYFIRQGHYFLNGFPFFIWLYFYTSSVSKVKLAEQNDENLDSEAKNEIGDVIVAKE